MPDIGRLPVTLQTRAMVSLQTSKIVKRDLYHEKQCSFKCFREKRLFYANYPADCCIRETFADTKQTECDYSGFHRCLHSKYCPNIFPVFSDGISSFQIPQCPPPPPLWNGGFASHMTGIMIMN
ncbi:TPA: hypothetical protein ACJMF5_001384, partial [Neisseria meningitidis]